MLAYSTIGTNDMDRARGFYDALFAEMGAKRMFDMETFTSYGVGPNQPMFAIARPYDGKEATVGNGCMVAIAAKDPAQVKALYDKARSLGATCEGEPGPRMNGAFSCGYVRDLDGNKLNFFCMGA
ncbi:MAG: VOC family protein [Alphaproteobacteria bacterium]|nr:VOC family protein [Alphaproteobacteria bacterium]